MLTPLEPNVLVNSTLEVENASLIQNCLSYKFKYHSLLLFIISLFNTIVFSSNDIYIDDILFTKGSMKARLRLDRGTMKAGSMHHQWNTGLLCTFIGLLCTMTKFDLFCYSCDHQNEKILYIQTYS